MRMHSTTIVVAVAVVAASLAACSKSAPETAPAPAPSADSLAKARADSMARAQAAAVSKAHADSVAAAQAAAAQAQAAKAARRADMMSTVYFDFDSSVLTDSAKRLLDRKVVLMNANATVGIQIEGHTDERGSSEYNLALGQRRAAAVKRYLAQHGIAEKRITIISIGEERPAVAGHDEAAWAKNRRAEFVITIGELTASS
jgi:peptidoglycan-associated lipoprotein